MAAMASFPEDVGDEHDHADVEHQSGEPRAEPVLCAGDEVEAEQVEHEQQCENEDDDSAGPPEDAILGPRRLGSGGCGPAARDMRRPTRQSATGIPTTTTRTAPRKDTALTDAPAKAAMTVARNITTT